MNDKNKILKRIREINALEKLGIAFHDPNTWKALKQEREELKEHLNKLNK